MIRRFAMELALAGLAASILVLGAVLVLASADGAAAGRGASGILASIGASWRLAGPLAVALGLSAVAARWRTSGWLVAAEISGRSPRVLLAVAAAVALALSPWTAAIEAGCGPAPAPWEVRTDRVRAPDGRTVDLATLEVRPGAPPAGPSPSVVDVVIVQVPAGVLLVAAALHGGPAFFLALGWAAAAAALVRAEGSAASIAASMLPSFAAFAWTGRRSRPPG